MRPQPRKPPNPLVVTRRLLLSLSAAIIPTAGPTCRLLAATAANPTAPQRFLVEAAPLDRRRYRGIVLSNGMRVLLASDPEATYSAAALTVDVGSLSNPPEWPGLAHFLEHMLFRGSKRFDDGEFERFVADYGGTSNAFTRLEQTTYFFDVGAANFAGSLERFADLFIAPSLTPSSTEREVAAIESEHSRNLPADSWRTDQLFRSTQASVEHPYSRFFTGNRQTLCNGDASARAALRRFYQDYYRAPQMSVTMTGPQRLDSLQDLAVASFAKVPAGSSPAASTKYDPLPLPIGASTSALLIVPVRNSRSLTLTWCLPILDADEWVRSKPDQLLASLLSSRTEGSVLSYLKRAGLGNVVEASIDERTHAFLSFSVYVGLTERGVERWPEAASALFSYLRMLREQGVPAHVYDDARAIRKLGFAYDEPAEPRSFAASSAPQLPLYAPAEWLTGPALLLPGTEEGVQYLLQRLMPSQLAATRVASKSFEGIATKTEPIYGTRYGEIEISDRILAWSGAPRLKELSPPKPNPFIPTQFAIKAGTSAPAARGNAAGGRAQATSCGVWSLDCGVRVVPELLTRREGLRVHFLQDRLFQRPKAFALFVLRTGELYKSASASIEAEIYQLLLEDTLDETTFPAAQAGLGVSSAVFWGGLSLTLSGFDQRIPDLMALVAATLRKVRRE